MWPEGNPGAGWIMLGAGIVVGVVFIQRVVHYTQNVPGWQLYFHPTI